MITVELSSLGAGDKTMSPAFILFILFFGQVVCLLVHPAKEKVLELRFPSAHSPHQLLTAGFFVVVVEELVVRRQGLQSWSPIPGSS